MSNRFHLASREEKILFDYLKKGTQSTRQHKDIIEELKNQSIPVRTINRMLKENEGKRIFRIKKNNKIFYRLNDFPLEIQAFFIAVDEFPEVLNPIKDDVLKFYPNLSFDQILDFWYEGIKALGKGDKRMLEAYEKLKEYLE